MRPGAGLVALAALASASALLGASVLLGACSREEDKPKAVDLAPGFTRVPLAADGGGARSVAAAPRDVPWPGDVDSSAPRPLTVMVTRTVYLDGGPATAPAPVNPDDAVLERARVAGASCFSTLRAGPGIGPMERSAHIAFTVIPTGTVSRADVSSSDTTDEGVLACLRQQALSTTFSDNAGGPLRSYAIDVRVFANGSGGGR